MKHAQAIQLAILSISLVAFSALSARAQEVVLPKPEPPFQGQNRTHTRFPKECRSASRSFERSLSSPFGGPIQTPNFQRVADSGLRLRSCDSCIQ